MTIQAAILWRLTSHPACPRLTEVAQMEPGDLSPDLVAQPGARVVPLKGAREYYKGRYVPFTPSTGRALIDYLRARNKRPGADQPALWLSTRGQAPLSGSGIYQMLKRRTRQAGYDPKTVWPTPGGTPWHTTGWPFSSSAIASGPVTASRSPA